MKKGSDEGFHLIPDSLPKQVQADFLRRIRPKVAANTL